MNSPLPRFPFSYGIIDQFPVPEPVRYSQNRQDREVSARLPQLPFRAKQKRKPPVDLRRVAFWGASFGFFASVAFQLLLNASAVGQRNGAHARQAILKSGFQQKEATLCKIIPAKSVSPGFYRE